MSNFKITKVTAFVAIDPVSGNEGILICQAPDGQYIPLICDRPATLKAVFLMAKCVAAQRNIEYKIIEFSIREDVTEEVKKRYGA